MSRDTGFTQVQGPCEKVKPLVLPLSISVISGGMVTVQGVVFSLVLRKWNQSTLTQEALPSLIYWEVRLQN